jgi:predicted MFS family arabinose efflux permease
MWRDLGYAIGAVVTGLIADSFGIGASIVTIGILTILSSLVVAVRMQVRRSYPVLAGDVL